MMDKMTNTDYSTQTDNQLIEALANAWFQALILTVLAIGIPILAGLSIEVWKWPVLLVIPLVAWWFGRWYGRFNEFQSRSGLL